MKRVVQLIIAFNVCTHITIIPCIMGINTIVSVCFVCCLINIFGIIAIRIINNDKTKKAKRFIMKPNSTIILFFLVLLWEILKSPFVLGEDRYGFSITVFIYQLSFLVLLINSYKYYSNSLKLILQPYVVISSYILITTLLSWALLNISLLKMGNPVEYYPMLSDINKGALYNFPSYLTVYITNAVRVPMLQTYGIPCGLSHEPHISSFFVIPAIMFYLAMEKRNSLKYICVFLLISFIILSTSVTSMIVILIILFTYFATSNKYQNLIISVLFVIALLSLYSIIFHPVGDIYIEWSSLLADKGSFDEDSSGEYTLNRIIYLLNPNDFWGSTLYGTAIGNNRDVGIVTSILNLLFFISLSRDIIINVIKSKGDKYFVSFGCLYFLLHSIKTTSLNYQYPLTVFIIFITFIINNNSYEDKRLFYNKHI